MSRSLPAHPPARTLSRLALGGLALGSALAGYGALVEVRWFALREVRVPVLPPDRRDLRVLHLSDLHLTPGQHAKRRWIRSLAALEPDLVVNTGDNLGHRDSVPALIDALGGLLDVPGVFVRGSNDYFAPTVRNPVRYLLPDDGSRHVHSPLLPWRDMVRDLTAHGWTDLDNATGELTVGGTRIAFAGVDDPHLEYDDLAALPTTADRGADLRVGVAHAPYLRVLDRFAAAGHDLILAGHTHGGQLCLPGGRALVTNCDLEPARARGLHRHPLAPAPETAPRSWLHVSAGLGTSPYAPVRLCCRPEATLLTLTARPGS